MSKCVIPYHSDYFWYSIGAIVGATIGWNWKKFSSYVGSLLWSVVEKDEIYSLVSPDNQRHFVGGRRDGIVASGFIIDGMDYVNNESSIEDIRKEVNRLRLEGWVDDLEYAKSVM